MLPPLTPSGNQARLGGATRWALGREGPTLVARVPVDLLADEFVRVPGGVEVVWRRGPLEFREWPKWAMRGGEVPITRAPEDVVVVVAGGAGALSTVACTWSHWLSAPRPVDRYLAGDPGRA